MVILSVYIFLFSLLHEDKKADVMVKTILSKSIILIFQLVFGIDNINKLAEVPILRTG